MLIKKYFMEAFTGEMFGAGIGVIFLTIVAAGYAVVRAFVETKKEAK